MSGGVDSSVAAALLREQGYDVVGVAMRLAPEPASPVAKRRGTCCSHDDFEDARRVAERMDFPFYVIDLRADFGARVIDNFVSEYLGGPHAESVRDVQSRDQVRSPVEPRPRARGGLRRDRPLCANRARRCRPRSICCARPTTPRISRTFYSRSASTNLSRTMFPLGAMTKTEVRARARALGLANADKPESQEICFVPDGDYARFVERRSDGERRNCARERSSTAKERALADHAGDASIHRRAAARAWVSPAASRFMCARFAPSRAKWWSGRARQLNSSGLIARESAWSMPRLALGQRAVRRSEDSLSPSRDSGDDARRIRRAPRGGSLRIERPGGDAGAGVRLLSRRRSARRRLYRAGDREDEARPWQRGFRDRNARMQGQSVRFGDDRVAAECARHGARANSPNPPTFISSTPAPITDRADAESLRIARRARRLNPDARDRDDRMPGAGESRRAGESDRRSMRSSGSARLDDLERAVAHGAGERVMVTNLRKERAPIELARGHARRSYARVSEAAGRLRPVLHLLYRAVLARHFAQRRAAPGRSRRSTSCMRAASRK